MPLLLWGWRDRISHSQELLRVSAVIRSRGSIFFACLWPSLTAAPKGSVRRTTVNVRVPAVLLTVATISHFVVVSPASHFVVLATALALDRGTPYIALCRLRSGPHGDARVCMQLTRSLEEVVRP